MNSDCFKSWTLKLKGWLDLSIVPPCNDSTPATGELVILEDRVLFSAVPFSIELVVPGGEPIQELSSLDGSVPFTGVDLGFPITQAAIEANLNRLDAHLQSLIVLDALENGFTTEPITELVSSKDRLNQDEPTRPATTHELVVIDRSVQNYEALVADLLNNATPERHFEIRYLSDYQSSGLNGLQQLTQTLANARNLDALHLITHGADGQLYLGDLVLNQQVLIDHAEEISDWRLTFNAGADWLLYGCQVAESETGRAFVSSLAELTGLEIAASSNATGSQQHNGDWIFEYNVGAIETSLAFSLTAQQQWDGWLGEVGVGATANFEDQFETSAQGRGNHQSVATDANGNFVIVWSANGDGIDDWNVYGQRFDRFQNSLSGPFLISDAIVDGEVGKGDQNWAAIDMDAAGNFVVTWTDHLANDSIYYRYYQANGNSLTGAIKIHDGVNTIAGTNSTVSMNDSGQFVIAWQGAGTGDTGGVFASLFDISGTPIFSNRLVNFSETTGPQTDVSVSINNLGETVFTWTQSNGIFAQRFNSSGVGVGTAFEIANNLPFALFTQYHSSVQLLNDGSFVTSFTNQLFGDEGVDAVVYSATDTRAQVISGNVSLFGDQHDTDITVLGNGMMVLVWSGAGDQSGNTDSNGVFYRVYHSNGTPFTSEQRVNLGTTGVQKFASVATIGYDEFVIVWSGQGDSSNEGVYSRTFDLGLPAPDPVLEDGAVTINENAFVGRFVFDFNVTNSNQSNLTYEIVSGNEDSKFSIDSTLGRIFTAGKLDFEAVSDYVLTVKVTNTDGGFDFADVYISVGDVADGVIAGAIIEDIIGDGAIVNDSGSGGVTVKLYRDQGDAIISNDDLLVATTTTNNSGQYAFSGLIDGNYYVVVDSKTISSANPLKFGFNNNDIWAEQTYASRGALIWNSQDQSWYKRFIDGALFGGMRANRSDNAAALTTSEHVSTVAINGSSVSNLDFGFSFNVVSNVRGGNSDDFDPSPNRSVQGSLRQFIANANAISGGNEMRFVPMSNFNNSNAGGNWWRIDVTEALPSIVDAGIIIDGRAYHADGISQRNDNQNLLGVTTTVGVGVDGVAGTGDEALLTAMDAPELELRGRLSIARGLGIQASDVTIRNLAIFGFGAGNDLRGNIVVNGSGLPVTGVTIENNVLGSGAGSFSASTTGDAQASNIRILQADHGVIQNNLIGFSNFSGITIAGNNSQSDGADHWLVQRNQIFSNALTKPEHDGINIVKRSLGTQVLYNLITDNSGYGVDTWHTDGQHVISENTISGNGIGLIETAGVRLYGIGSTVQFNAITNNVGAGVNVVGLNSLDGVAASTGNLISKNSFSGNSSAAIDLIAIADDNAMIDQGDGISPNDNQLNSTSGNTGLDYIELTNAYQTTDGLHLEGKLNSSTTLDRIELYLAAPQTGDDCNGQTFGEGEFYLGTVLISDLFSFDPATQTFTALLTEPVGGWPTALPNGAITSIAIESATRNTSEFSRNLRVGTPPQPPQPPQLPQPPNDRETDPATPIVTQPPTIDPPSSNQSTQNPAADTPLVGPNPETEKPLVNETAPTKTENSDRHADPGETSKPPVPTNAGPELPTAPTASTPNGESPVVQIQTANTLDSDIDDADSVFEPIEIQLRLDDDGYRFIELARASELVLHLGTDRTIASAIAVSTLDTTILAGMFWDELDTAKQEYLHHHLQIGVPTIAASTASLLTVGYLAWIVRSGVLLTTLVSSMPAWNALDIVPIIESSNLKEEDESIEQMVDY